MPYELFLALRHLRSSRGRGLAQVTALVAILGTTCGVAVLIIATALANGFRDELRSKILRGTAHITLLREGHKSISEWRETVKRVSALPGVLHAAATRYDGALLISSDGAAYAVLRAVDPHSRQTIAEVGRTLVEGNATSLLDRAAVTASGTHRTRDNAKGERKQSTEGLAEGRDDELDGDARPVDVVIGSELATRLNLRIGDEAQLVVGARAPASSAPSGSSRESSNQNRLPSNSWSLNATTLVPQESPVRVVGIFRSGLYEYDATWVYISLPHANALTKEGDTASAISIEVTDIFKTPEVAARVRAAVGSGFMTVDWQEANRPLFAALELERRMVTLIIGLILMLAALNITATLVLLVTERRADIAILSTVGTPARAIMLIFIIEGAVIGFVGVLGGVFLGLLTCFVGDHFKLVELPADVYSISYVPFHPQAADVVLTASIAFAISLLATIYPARAAARVRPAEALRDK